MNIKSYLEISVDLKSSIKKIVRKKRGGGEDPIHSHCLKYNNSTHSVAAVVLQFLFQNTQYPNIFDKSKN